MDNYNYPEGSDTRDAPWNQPDAPEPEQRDIDEATAEIHAFASFDESATMNDIYNANEYMNTIQTGDAVELCECNADKPNPLAAVPDELKNTIMKQAQDYIDERAQEIVNDRCDDERDRLEAKADDDYDRMREERGA